MLVALLLLVASSSPLSVKPSCFLDATGFEVHVEIESRWRKGTDGNPGSSGPQLLHLECDLHTKKCAGLKLPLETKALGSREILLIPGKSLSEARLTSWSGRVAVVTWGVNQWLVNFNSGTVSSSDHAGSVASDPAEVAVGNASCGTLNDSKAVSGVVFFEGR